MKTVLNFKISKNALVLVTLCLLSNFSFSQQQNIQGFYKTVDSVIKLKPRSQSILDSVFIGIKQDTIKLSYLVHKSHHSSYLEGECFALNSLGTYFRNISNYDQAINLYSRALSVAIESKNLEMEVISLNMLGVVYRRMDAIRSALDYHKQALDLAENAPVKTLELRRSIAVSQNSMGNIYTALKQYDLALIQFYKSLAVEEELNNKLGLAINNHNIGYAKEKLGFYDEAMEYYNKSLLFNYEIDSEIGIVICFNSIGKVYIFQEKYYEANHVIQDGLSRSIKANDQFYIAISYINYGLTQLRLNNLEQAETNLIQGLEIAKKFNLKSSEIEAYKYLAEVHEKKGEFDIALNNYRKHVSLDEILTGERNIQYVNDLIIKYETEKKNNQIKELASENEIVKLRLEKNKRTLLLSLLGAGLVFITLYVLYRQRQLKNEKKILTLEQEMLRNQMNPHFIFNSLNSIKLYIINNEKENAVYYLNKFSKLIRKILIASTEKEISLEDEIETMSLYMNIENIRFSNEIDYHVEIDKDLNMSSIKVPSLILQPFLENAIWHGLSAKTQNKKIELVAQKNSPTHLTITISDNGIGRAAADIIKNQKKIKQHSIGIHITKARLENFSKNFKEDYHISIRDLYDSDNVAAGTQVILNIPIK
ncbi:tetratricopeptide repeat-containing sensor histidine kinase [Bizionia myxarmorum]|uniref:Tetratricopeptide repeat protein n=1 Tax=Bizionia myxarmorum TaxID=291186 RepID=A0A5D0RAF0_9FLAO|nr:tetratricopeptide repeat protein [Bizionia myxarmorum]TYB78492.1 tetratricopeptide repeat protein [Bizionia myxarmorum]